MHPPATNAPSTHHAETMAPPDMGGFRLLPAHLARRIFLGQWSGSLDPDQGENATP